MIDLETKLAITVGETTQFFFSFLGFKHRFVWRSNLIVGEVDLLCFRVDWMRAGNSFFPSGE